MAAFRSPANDARLFVASALALLAVLMGRGESRADSEAHFWLSEADMGPVVPVIYALPGSVGEIQVRSRPANGYRLTAFSLDLQAETSGVVSFTGVEVLNPELQDRPELHRHQLIFDSETGLDVTPDLIDSFLGYSFFENVTGISNGAGIGPFCGLDPDCSMMFGDPSWQVATVWYEAGMSFGATELYLAIGEHGLWQSPPNVDPPEMPDETSAVFGLMGDAVNEWDVDYETEPPDDDDDHRHMPQGVADAVIVVASADFDEDGDVDGADFLTWQLGVGEGMTHAEGDADGDGAVDASDLAAWRYQFVATMAAVSIGTAVPEPMGLGALLASVVMNWASRRRHGVADV
jgi:hypothetical protein